MNLFRPAFGKVEVFFRHCLYSHISAKKKRPPFFSHEACFQNLLSTLNPREANLTLFLDTVNRKLEEEHFLRRKGSSYPLITVEKGSEASSFLALAEYIASLKLHPNTILYLVEDDYLHRPGWTAVLKEAFSLPAIEYATLYDHADKYDPKMYPKLKSRLYATKSCHWRTTPSTTHTFAVRFSTFLEDLSIHRKFSENRKISVDHKKFLRLGRRGRVLVSALPGYSTHMDPEALSPAVDWMNL